MGLSSPVVVAWLALPPDLPVDAPPALAVPLALAATRVVLYEEDFWEEDFCDAAEPVHILRAQPWCARADRWWAVTATHDDALATLRGRLAAAADHAVEDHDLALGPVTLYLFADRDRAEAAARHGRPPVVYPDRSRARTAPTTSSTSAPSASASRNTTSRLGCRAPRSRAETVPPCNPAASATSACVRPDPTRRALSSAPNAAATRAPRPVSVSSHGLARPMPTGSARTIVEHRDNSRMPPPPWDPADPFVLDADGFVLGLKAAPPHYARLIAEGWEGGHNLFPLVRDAPEAFTADLLVYRRASDGRTLTLSLTESAPYTYL